MKGSKDLETGGIQANSTPSYWPQNNGKASQINCAIKNGIQTADSIWDTGNFEREVFYGALDACNWWLIQGAGRP